ncbi:unnamed protein product [Parnassius apollo]|uniref:(apollo) hypothetical protein n=1 Tax=Parnassius apollo TaxID=110799 RepID=A0A8S3WIW0_PARAO|nr:unnamed protein product [Parnassius apollo]
MSGVLIFLFPEEFEQLTKENIRNMGKGKQYKNKDVTKFLYKKYNSSTLTKSRTISNVSPFSNTSVLQLKNNISTNNLHKNHGKIMRDYCMETDFCILRRYCKAKKNKMKNKKVSSSKYTVINKATANKFKKSVADSSGCGDSKQTTKGIEDNIEDFNANLTNLVIKKLNELLRDWVKDYLLNNNETKQKIQSVLDSIVHKLETNNKYASSCSTYTVDIQIRKSKSNTTNHNYSSTSSQSYKHKSTIGGVEEPEYKTFSMFTVPMAEKHFSIINSTLTIPRYFHACHHQIARKVMCNPLYKVKRTYKKKVLLTISKSNKLLSNTPSVDLLTISTQSLTKHFATYRDKNTINRNSRKRRIVLIPNSYYKFPNSLSITHINEEFLNKLQRQNETNQPLDTMPSLVRTIFTDELSNLESSERSLRLENLNDSSTMAYKSLKQNKSAGIEKVELFREKETNMSPCETVNVALGNDSLYSQYREIETNMSLQQLTISSRNSTKENYCPCLNTKVYETMSCKACFKSNDEGESDPLLTIDFLDHNIGIYSSKEELDQKKPSVTRNSKMNSLKNIFSTKRKKKCCFMQKKDVSTDSLKFEKIQNKCFSYLYKKSDNNFNHNEFLTHFQDMFNYFANYKGKRNINLDIHINVFPTLEDDTGIQSQKTKLNDVITSQTVILNDESNLIKQQTLNNKLSKSNEKLNHCCNCQPKIISLLDGASNHLKYVKNKETCTGILEKSDQIPRNINDQITTTADLEIAQEIFELRTIIKDLAVTAEKFVNEHLNAKVDTEKSNVEPMVLFSTNVECKPLTHTDRAIRKALVCKKRISKGTQLANNSSCQVLSDIIINKEAQKKNTQEFQARLMKKSTSYNIIDSETILKVTDMTSAAQTFTPNEVMDAALTCSLPKCKSLYDISVDSNKNKFVAYYYEEFLRKPTTDKFCNSPCPASTSHTENFDELKYKEIKMQSEGKFDLEVEENKLAETKPMTFYRKQLIITEGIIDNFSKDTESAKNSTTKNFVIKTESVSSSSPIKIKIDTSEQEINEEKERYEEDYEKIVLHEILSDGVVEKYPKLPYYLVIPNPIEELITKLNGIFKSKCKSLEKEHFIVDFNKKLMTKSNRNFVNLSPKQDYLPPTVQSLYTSDTSKYILESDSGKYFEEEQLSVNVAQIKNICQCNINNYPLKLRNNTDCTLKKNNSITNTLSRKSSYSSSLEYSSSEISNTTLIGPNVSNMLFNNSSSFIRSKDIFLGSDYTLTPSCESVSVNKISEIVADYSKNEQVPNIADIITFPNIKPLSHLKEDYKCENYVMVANTLSNIKPCIGNLKNIDDNNSLDVQLQIPENCPNDYKMHLNPPQVTDIKPMVAENLNGNNTYNREFKIEFTKDELLETLTMALDVTINRLEKTLSEKIVNELKKSLSSFKNSLHVPCMPQKILWKAETETIGDSLNVNDKVSIENIVLPDKKINMEKDEYFQCNLVSTSFIDTHFHKLQLKKRTESLRKISVRNNQNLKEPKLIGDYLENIKSPTTQSTIETTIMDRGDSTTISIEDTTVERLDKFRYLKTLFRCPISIVLAMKL